MPVIESQFRTVPWLRNGHLQTVLASLRRIRGGGGWRTDRLPGPNFQPVWMESLRGGFNRVAVLGHGMEGSSRSRYIRALGARLFQEGWDVVAWNLRGCGPFPGCPAGWYHAGQTEDLRSVVDHLSPRYPRIALVGVSLGGNLLLKYLGEGGVPLAVKVAAAVSAPLDLEASALALDRRTSNRLYLENFLSSFWQRIRGNSEYPFFSQRGHLGRPRSMEAVDSWYTAPLYGFQTVWDYWQTCSASRFIPEIRVPTLVLNARDDPFLTRESFPDQVFARSPCAVLEAPGHGGHVAFLDCKDGLSAWWEGRVAEFFAASACE